MSGRGGCVVEFKKTRCPGSGRGHAPSGLERCHSGIGQFERPVVGAAGLYRRLFAALKEADYDGYLGIECRISGPYDEALAESAALLRELWDAA